MWFPFAFAFAILTSVHIPLIKHLAKGVNSITFVFTNNFFALPFLLIITLLLTGFPNVTHAFYLYAFLASIMDMLSFVLSIWAFKYSSISLVTPLSSVTPLFTTIAAIVYLKEPLEMRSLVGMIIIIIGAYFLNISNVK